MTLYVVHYGYTDDPAALDAHRPAHRDFITGLAVKGVVLLSGPYGEPGPPAAMLIVRASSEAEVLGHLRDDPFQALGLIAEVSIREWTPVRGSLLGTLLEGYGSV